MKASTSIGSCGPQGSMVVRALKTYGGYVSDTGNQDALYFGNRSNGSNRGGHDTRSRLYEVLLRSAALNST